MSNQDSRGFAQLVGKTIQAVDTSAINTVLITFTDGTQYSIWGEDRHYDIEVIKAVEETNV